MSKKIEEVTNVLYEYDKDGNITSQGLQDGEIEFIQNYITENGVDGLDMALQDAGFALDLETATITVSSGNGDNDSDNGMAALGVGLDITESLGGFSSSVLKDRFKYGEKYYNKPITVRTKLGPGINTNANSLKNLKKTGKLAGRTTKVLVVADVAMSGEIRASHVLTATMIGVNAILVAGNVISGIYFSADLITMGASYFMTGEAKGIGDYLDQALDDAGVTSDGGTIVEMYEGFY